MSIGADYPLVISKECVRRASTLLAAIKLSDVIRDNANMG